MSTEIEHIIENESEQQRIRREKLDALRSDGADPYLIREFDQTAHTAEIVNSFEEFEGKTVRIAGRLMSKRGMGKVSFCDLADMSGRIQVFTKIDSLGEEAYAKWQQLDLGDIVGVEGEVFRTMRGEISVKTATYSLLAKGLRPLPEKFHGLKDTDTRYRKRYLDLIVNPEVQAAFFTRSKIIGAVRRKLEDCGFVEVETPVLNAVAGGATARPFVTHHNTLDLDLFLRISPELYLKRLIIGGFEKVFEIGRVFRNEGMSVKHNPEFSLLELYQSYVDYHEMMNLTEQLFVAACEAVLPSQICVYQGEEINLKPPFRRLTMCDAVLEATGVNFALLETDDDAREAARTQGMTEISATATWGEVLNLFFEVFCEELLRQPTFICDYPVEISPLTKHKPNTNGRIVERFELFIGGREFANAYSELNDSQEQRRRFAAQMAKHEAGDEEASLLDEDFCVAMEYGMPPAGGLGIGLDRFVMLLTDSASIRDVLLFPTMKPVED